jgi:hypothetical protein
VDGVVYKVDANHQIAKDAHRGNLAFTASKGIDNQQPTQPRWKTTKSASLKGDGED